MFRQRKTPDRSDRFQRDAGKAWCWMNKKVPLRQCIGCGQMKGKKEMMRILRTTEGEIVLDTVSYTHLVDIGVANGDKPYIFMKGLQMAACAVAAMLLGTGSARFAAVCGQGIGAQIRKEEYRKLQQFSFSNTDRFRTSSLVTRLTGDVTNIQNSIANGLRPACRAPVMMLTRCV